MVHFSSVILGLALSGGLAAWSWRSGSRLVWLLIEWVEIVEIGVGFICGLRSAWVLSSGSWVMTVEIDVVRGF